MTMNRAEASMYAVHAYEVRPRKDKRGVNLISDALPFGRLWYDGPNAASNAIGYAKPVSRPHGAVIRVYDDAGNMIETHEHAGDFPGSGSPDFHPAESSSRRSIGGRPGDRRIRAMR